MIDPTIPMLLAARRNQVKSARLIPKTTTTGECVGCGCALLLAPSSAELISRNLSQPVCFECAARHHDGTRLSA